MRRLLGLLLVPLLLAVPTHAEDLYLQCGRLFDGTARTIRTGISVLVRDRKIVEVGPNLTPPAGARVIDLGGMTVLPGLIDAHTHIALHPGNYNDQVLRETAEFRAIWATQSARLTLEGGITTIRDLGNEGAGYADLAVRDAVRQGLVPGPRVLAAIQPVSATGSYGLLGFSPRLRTPPIAYEADGPTEVRRQVRVLVREGADVIKVYMESFEKRLGAGDALSGARNFAPEELAAVVDEAHASGLKVAAHTYSDAAARQAIAAGVDSIEHGLYLSEETLALMASKNIAYVPTLLVYELWRDGKILAPVSTELRARLATTVTRHTETFRRALRTPVKIVFGSDTFELPGQNAQELEAMVRDGMQPVDALRAATAQAADLLGIGDTTGTLEKGKAADIVAVSGDPLGDIRALRNVVFVMQAGKVLVDKH